MLRQRKWILAGAAVAAAAAGGACGRASAAPQPLIISEYLANPQGTDSPFEYVELVATQSINFATTPYSVIVANNGTATAAGWTASGALTYGFTINAGSVARGDVVYVGGTTMAPGGNPSVTKVRAISTGTTAGDTFGNANTSGVVGNGGSNADGIAVFNVPASAVTTSTVPVDAVFYGSAAGTAVVSGGTAGYVMPVNDLYNGGFFQSTSFLAPDPAGGDATIASGTYDPNAGSWTTPRTFANVAAPAGATTGDQNNGTPNTAALTIPEPASAGMLGLAGLLVLRRRRAGR